MSFIHELALVESDQVGDGTRVWPFAHLMTGCVVGAACNIGEHVFVESGVRVGDRVTVKNNVLLWDGVVVENDVFLGPNAVFTNDPNPRAPFKKSRDRFVGTLVQEGASVGANSTIVCGVRIGRYAMVGAGSVVTRDVPDHALVYGNPARRHGWVCTCGERLGEDWSCRCGRVFEMTDDGLAPQA